MEIEIAGSLKDRLWVAATAGGVLLIVALALLGRIVTPAEGGAPVLLTPARWQAYQLAHITHQEVLRLQADARDLGALLTARNPDPVATQLMAQRIYANQRSDGTAVTAPARQALIEAAQAAALAASGARPASEATNAYNAAVELIRRLSASQPEGNSSATGSPVSAAGAPAQ